MGHDTDKANTDYISYKLGKWVEALRWEDLPDAVINELRRYLLDSIGCAFGGVQTPDWGILRGIAQDEGGSEKCALLGEGGKVAPLQAAFLNALSIRAQDYNDIYWQQDPCHPSDCLSAPLAGAELAEAGGKEFLLGMLVAYEIEQRLCEVSFPGIRELGWHHATLTAFAAAYAAGKSLGLTAEQLQHAAGIAGAANVTLGAVTAGHLTMMKNTVSPMATRAGLEAAFMAMRGFSGPAHIFEGKESLEHVMDSKWKWEIFDDLGSEWRILQCGMKFFPTEALTHAPISCTISICQDNGLAADDIAEIRIKTLTKAADILSDPAKYRPTTRESADHSLPYCITMGIMNGRVTPDLFDEEIVRDPHVLDHIDKIKVFAEPDFEAAFPKVQRCHVAIDTTDGRNFEKQIDWPKGDPRDPLTDSEIRAKFDALAQGLSTERGDEIWNEAAKLPDYSKVADFVALLKI